MFVEMPLVSSHTPWAPLPQFIDWDDVGDGSVYKQIQQEGKKVRSIWKDPVKLRREYSRSIQYTMTTVISWLELYGDENTVMVFLGDHQPSPLIVGDTASHDVPITILAKDKTVMAKTSSWGWTDGIKPGSEGADLEDGRVPGPVHDHVRSLGRGQPGARPAEALTEAGRHVPGVGNRTPWVFQARWTSRRRTEPQMLILGLILLLLGIFLNVSILYTIGAILLVVGAVLWILGAVGRPIGEKSGSDPSGVIEERPPRRAFFILPGRPSRARARPPRRRPSRPAAPFKTDSRTDRQLDRRSTDTQGHDERPAAVGGRVAELLVRQVHGFVRADAATGDGGAGRSAPDAGGRSASRTARAAGLGGNAGRTASSPPPGPP